MNKDKKVYIFDTTLRDGQQCPGAGMSFEKNVEYALLATEVGVDVIEAGFPAASKLDFSIVYRISELLSKIENGPTVAALCQLRDEQIDTTIAALEPAVATSKARLHTYLPVDPELMEASLGSAAKNKSQLVDSIASFCKRAISAGLEVEFSPEGYSRQCKNFDFVTDCIRAAVEAGARVINCPDTIGGAARYQGKDYFVNLMIQHAEIIAKEYPKKDIIWSAHCHNDFGLAVENTVNSVFEGPVQQIEGCFNGIGERAGNAALEQCIMVIKHFAEKLDSEKPYYTDIKTEKLQDISDFVNVHMLPRQPHWPISGDNAARHSSGGHTNAVIKNPLVYQPFNPKETGKEISLAFGPLSGGNHAKSIIIENGYICTDEEKAKIAQHIKNTFKDRRKGITDAELIQAYFEYRNPISVSEIDYWREKDESVLHLVGKFFEHTDELKESYRGEDSALTTLKQLIDKNYPNTKIENYHSESVGASTHAISVSTIILSDEGNGHFEGKGEDRDIGKSAIKALINAVNLAYINRHFRINKALTRQGKNS